MTHSHESFRKKVTEIFTRLAGADRAQWLDAAKPSRCMLQIANAISSKSGYPQEVGWDIGMNVADWQADAAFLVALHLFPEEFTDDEIDEGVRSLLIHVPDHVVDAAILAGLPVAKVPEEDKGNESDY
jgi:hypothetical protein